MFYAILNNISEAEIKGNHVLVLSLLDALRNCSIPDVGSSFTVTTKAETKDFKYDVPDTTKLPTIPENRNLTDYFAVVTPEIMVQLFVSMLFERRILVTSKKLSLVTAVVHGSVSLLYPMQWQHIYVPVLPPKLLDYCCAPMPFLLGVHSSMMDTVRRMPLDDVVIFDIDKSEFNSSFNDMEVFPREVSSKLLHKLKKLDRALDDYVASQFLRALVKVIGGYRDALRFKEQENEGGKIVFDEDAFLTSRSSSIKPFLEQILHLQSFMQFIAGRLDLMNAGIEVADVFEQEISNEGGDTHKWKFQHQQWVNKMKKGGGALKKTVGVQYAFLKGKANDMELKSRVKAFYKGAKSGVKTGYKGAKHQFKEIKQQLKTKETQNSVTSSSVKRSESLPAAQFNTPKNISSSPFRHTMYSTLPSHRVKHGPKAQPHLKTDLGISRSTSSDCISMKIRETSAEEDAELALRLQKTESHSETNVANLIDFDEPVIDDTNAKQLQETGESNPSFSEDQYFVIDDDDIHLNLEDAKGKEGAEKAGWVTFDESPTGEVKIEDEPSPIVEVVYEDLFRNARDESYLIVSAGDDNIANPSASNIDFESSLLQDTLSSMSLETRTLFAKPSTDHSESLTEESKLHEDFCKPEIPVYPDSQNEGKKKRRPPPRPPPPSVDQRSVSRTPNVSTSQRNNPSSKPVIPRNRPTLTSTTFNDLKTKTTLLNQRNSAQTNSSGDPFAELLNETRNGIAQNLKRN